MPPTPARAHRVRHPLTSSILACGLLFLGVGPGGCGSEKPLRTSPEPYRGPAVALDSGGSQHIAIVTTPTGGWSVQLDQARRRLEATDAFITLRRPNPAVLTTQALVEHRVATSVPTGTAVVVYVRVLEDRQSGEGVSYRRVDTRQ